MIDNMEENRIKKVSIPLWVEKPDLPEMRSGFGRQFIFFVEMPDNQEEIK